MLLSPQQKVVLNLFGGAGGTEIGLRAAGWHSTDTVEYNPHACATLRTNFPEMHIHTKDIHDVRVAEYSQRSFPVAVYTFPCDHYCSYGAIHRTQNGDDLYLHALRNHVLLWPEAVLIENVLGMRQKFPVVMELWRGLPQYYTTEFTVYGHEFTLMRKTRLFLLLHRQPYIFPSLDAFLTQHDIPLPILLARPGRRLQDYLEDPAQMDERSRNDVLVTPYIRTRVRGGYKRPGNLYDPEQHTPVNLPTNYGRDRSVAMVKDEASPYGYRPFSHRELARLHGFPDSHQFCGGKNARFTQIVDAVMPPVAYAFFWLLNHYFASIDELLPQPKSLGYRFVSAAHSRTVRRISPSRHSQVHLPDPERIVQAALF